MEISTDLDGTVYVRWHAGGHWTALTEGGSVTQDAIGGRVEWVEYEPDERGGYEEGFAAGLVESKRRSAARAASKVKVAAK